jgi:hypothetical protein
MRISPHAVTAIVLVAVAAVISVPVFLAVGTSRATPVTTLSVSSDRARPVILTADRALGPIEAKFSGSPGGNPFETPKKGQRNRTLVPQPPPPPLQLPEPPLTPFLTAP